MSELWKQDPIIRPQSGNAWESDPIVDQKQSSPSSFSGTVKQFGVGMAKGALSIADLFSQSPEQYANDRGGGGFSDPTESKLPPQKNLSEAVQMATGKFREPQNRLEGYADTIGSFIPTAAIGGAGSLPLKLAKYAVIPGIASEAAGQATEGTKYEPYARVVGAVAGAGIPSLLRKATTPFSSTIEQQKLDHQHCKELKVLSMSRQLEWRLLELPIKERSNSQGLQCGVPEWMI